MPLDKVGKNFAWPCEQQLSYYCWNWYLELCVRALKGLENKQKKISSEVEDVFCTPNYHPYNPWIGEQKEIRKGSCILSEVALAGPKSCSLIIPAKATLTSQGDALSFAGWFLLSAGFMFVLSTAQSPDLVLPDLPPDRVIVSAWLWASGLVNFGILSC